MPEKYKPSEEEVQKENALDNKEMESEKTDENLEVKNLEELKQKAIEAGASPEEIEALDAKLEIARMGADGYVAQLEDEYNKAVKQRQNLESWTTEDRQEDYKKGRIIRDMAISGALSVGSLGVAAGAYVGGGKFTAVSIAIAAGLFAGGVGLAGSSIDRLQDWFARRKRRKELDEAYEK